ncbi:MAG: hypothetical protein ACO3N2_09250 [Arenicellales bacterium]
MRIVLTLLLASFLGGCSTLIDQTAAAIPGCASGDIEITNFVPGLTSDTISVMCRGKSYTCSYRTGRVYDCTAPEDQQSTGVES